VVTADARTIFDIWDSSKKYNPIPLTPEWLKRFGFELQPRKNHYEEYWKYGILTLHIYSAQATPVGVINSTKFKYVHQLQNLYFALTGTELPLKP
jgi:hypothetical protein